MSCMLELGPLSAADTRALIRPLLPADAAGEHLREQLAARAEGNPLFPQQMIALPARDRRTGTSACRPRSTRCSPRGSTGSRPPSGARSAPPRCRARVLGARRSSAARRQTATSRELLDSLARKQLVAPEPVHVRGRDGLRLQPHPGPRRRLRVDHQAGPRRAARAARRLAGAAPRGPHDRAGGDPRAPPRARLPPTAPSLARVGPARVRARAARRATPGLGGRRAARAREDTAAAGLLRARRRPAAATASGASRCCR